MVSAPLFHPFFASSNFQSNKSSYNFPVVILSHLFETIAPVALSHQKRETFAKKGPFLILRKNFSSFSTLKLDGKMHFFGGKF